VPAALLKVKIGVRFERDTPRLSVRTASGECCLEKEV
jgi:hypothetical protein